jgi:hypothetical protein
VSVLSAVGRHSSRKGRQTQHKRRWRFSAGIRHYETTPLPFVGGIHQELTDPETRLMALRDRLGNRTDEATAPAG